MIERCNAAEGFGSAFLKVEGMGDVEYRLGARARRLTFVHGRWRRLPPTLFLLGNFVQDASDAKARTFNSESHCTPLQPKTSRSLIARIARAKCTGFAGMWERVHL